MNRSSLSIEEPKTITTNKQTNKQDNTHKKATWMQTCGTDGDGQCSIVNSRYGVSTSEASPTAGFLQWRLESPSGKTGQVMLGEDVWLRNLHDVESHLDVCGQAAQSSCRSAYGVSTSLTQGGHDAAQKSGTWRLQSCQARIAHQYHLYTAL